MTPPSMKENLSKLNLLKGYDMSRPKQLAPVQTVQAYTQIVEILKNPKFTAPYAARASNVIKGKGFFIAESEKQQKEIYTKLFESGELLNNVGVFFRDTTRKLIDTNKFTLVGGKTCVVDLVRDVLKIVPVYWAANIAGIQLKATETAHGDYSPLVLYNMLSDIYTYIFVETDKANLMVLQAKVQVHVESLLNHISANLGLPSRISMIGTVSSLFKGKKGDMEQHEIVKRLRELGRPGSSEMANMILAIMVGSTAELSLGLINTVNQYLGSDHAQQIQSLATSSGDLHGYIHEGQRLDPPFKGVYRTAAEDVTIEDVVFKKDDRVFLDIAAACINGDVFSNPTAVDPARNPKDGYLHADGCFRYLGEPFVLRVMSEVLRVVFTCKNITRAPGQSGTLKRFKDEAKPNLRFAYLNEEKFTCPWPTSMAVQYDAA